MLLVDFFAVNWVPVWVLLVPAKFLFDFLYLLVDLFEGFLERSFIKLLFIHFADNIVFSLRFFVSEKVAKVIVFGSSGSVDSFLNELSSNFFLQIVLFGMGETDSEELDQLEFAFDFELIDERDKQVFELGLYFLILVFVFFVLQNKRVVLGIEPNGETAIFIDFFRSVLFLNLPEPVLSEEELFPDEHFEFFLSLFDWHVLIKDRNSFSFHIIDVEVFFSIVRVDGIELEKVLFSIG